MPETRVLPREWASSGRFKQWLTADPRVVLNAKIRSLIDGWNDRCHPFVWTKTAEQILKKANRKITSNAGH